MNSSSGVLFKMTTSLIPSATYLNYNLSLFVLQIILILGICRLLTVGGQYFNQPRVIFEIIGGIVLGPSALGKIHVYQAACFPKESLLTIRLIANVGLQLYLFVIGLELDLSHFVNNVQASGSIALFCMAVPFVLGIAISPLLYNTMETTSGKASGNFSSFFVFVGTAMSITPFQCWRAS